MQRARHLAVAICGFLAGVALVGMMMLTVTDVVLRAVFNVPIRGTLEIVELLLACTFFLALPAVTLRDEHIAVDVVGPRLRPLLKRIAEAIALVLIGILAWQGWKSAQDALAFGDVTSDLALPRILYWIPVLAGLVGGAVAAAVMALGKRAKR